MFLTRTTSGKTALITRITNNGYSDIGRVYLNVNPELSSLTVPNQVVGGNFSPIEIKFEGTVVSRQQVLVRDNVRNSDSNFNFDPSQSQRTFQYYIPPVASPRAATVTARSGGVSKSATTMIVPLKVDRVELTPLSIIGRYTGTGRVHLNGTAPQGGIAVQLSSNYAGITPLPSSITIGEGNANATFNFTTSVVTANLTRRITAAGLGSSVFAGLTLTPGGLRYFSISPMTVKGGNNMLGTFTLSGVVGGESRITVYSAQYMTYSSLVIVSAGSLSNSFNITTTSVGSTVQRTVSAVLGGVNKSVTVTLTP